MSNTSPPLELNGFVCPEEFRSQFTPLEFEQVVNMFCDFDSNGNGTIDYYEAQKIVYSLGATDSADKASRLMKLIDLNGSGEVDFAEFCRFFILLKKGDKSFAEFKGFLDLVYETPIGILYGLLG
jgi:Ca2+-binding EF-hand superfamily protein